MNTQPLRRVHPHIVAEHRDGEPLLSPRDAMLNIWELAELNRRGKMSALAALVAIVQTIAQTDGVVYPLSEPVERE